LRKHPQTISPEESRPPATSLGLLLLLTPPHRLWLFRRRPIHHRRPIPAPLPIPRNTTLSSTFFPKQCNRRSADAPQTLAQATEKFDSSDSWRRRSPRALEVRPWGIYGGSGVLVLLQASILGIHRRRRPHPAGPIDRELSDPRRLTRALSFSCGIPEEALHLVMGYVDA
jgi:hypothetical protein